MKRESPILADVLKGLKRLPHVYAWRNQVGLFIAVSGRHGLALEVLRSNGIAARLVDVGVEGSADLLVIVGDQACPACGTAVHPMPVAVEVKSHDGAQQPVQKTWQTQTWERRGGRYVVVRSVVEALCAVGVEK